MKVILKKEVKNIGKALEVKDVSDGYARNFLIPNKYALIASRANLAWLEKKKQEKPKRKTAVPKGRKNKKTKKKKK